MLKSYAPPGETSYDLWVERSSLIGVILSGVAYGILFVISLQAILLFLKPSNVRNGSRWHLIAYICFVFTLASIGFWTNVKFIQMTFIDDRNMPGWPNAFTVQFQSYWVNTLGSACYVVLAWTADALVLWRFLVVWNYMYWLSVVPILIYMGAISTSIALLVAMTRPGSSFWSPDAVKFTIAYGSLSVSLNTILTLSIAGRLLLASNRVRISLGPHHAKQYTSIAAMLVESSALYSVICLIFMVSYARNNPFQNVVLPLLGQIQGIAPVLILLRVAKGRAWSHKTFTTFTRNIAGTDTTRSPLTDEHRDSITPLDQIRCQVAKEDMGVCVCGPNRSGLKDSEEGKVTEIIVDRVRSNEAMV